MEKKVSDSKLRSRKVQGRRADWQELNAKISIEASNSDAQVNASKDLGPAEEDEDIDQKDIEDEDIDQKDIEDDEEAPNTDMPDLAQPLTIRGADVDADIAQDEVEDEDEVT